MKGLGKRNSSRITLNANDPLIEEFSHVHRFFLYIAFEALRFVVWCDFLRHNKHCRISFRPTVKAVEVHFGIVGTTVLEVVSHGDCNL